MKEKMSTKKNISIAKENKVAQRILDLAKERNYDLKRLFSYELTSKNLLFNEDGSLRKEKNKSDLVKELELYLIPGSYEEPNDFCNFTLILDVMLKCR